MLLPISDQAEEDINLIWDFIARDNIDAADRLFQDILQAIKQLMKWPRQGHVRPDISPNMRFWPVGSYLIVYREHPFFVIAVVHGARDISSILKSR